MDNVCKNKKKIVYLKKGQLMVISIYIYMLFIIVIFSSILFVNIYINSIVYPIKEDLFYIVQNTTLSMDSNKLKYYDYSINEEIQKEKIKKILYLNYKDRVILKSIKYNKSTNIVDIDVKVDVADNIIKKILKTQKDKKLYININEKVKIKMMEVK